MCTRPSGPITLPIFRKSHDSLNSPNGFGGVHMGRPIVAILSHNLNGPEKNGIDEINGIDGRHHTKDGCDVSHSELL